MRAVIDSRKDVLTVREDGTSVRPAIHDVAVRRLAPSEDERGDINEIYRPEWGLLGAPPVYVYQTMVRPGKVKGWVHHRMQDNRIFHMLGTLQRARFDDRPDSPTRGVWHAVKNIGLTDAHFVDMPTRPYDHADPDRYRVPLDDDRVPSQFDDRVAY